VVDEASAADKSAVNLANVFQLAGLGEFSQALLRADRVITL
jgi:sulfur relay protein tusD/dsrE